MNNLVEFVEPKSFVAHLKLYQGESPAAQFRLTVKRDRTDVTFFATASAKPTGAKHIAACSIPLYFTDEIGLKDPREFKETKVDVTRNFAKVRDWFAGRGVSLIAGKLDLQKAAKCPTERHIKSFFVLLEE